MAFELIRGAFFFTVAVELGVVIATPIFVLAMAACLWVGRFYYRKSGQQPSSS